MGIFTIFPRSRHSSGGKASALRDQWESQTREIAAGLRGWVIRRPRAELHARIAGRTRAMLEGGALEEVAALGEVSSNCGMAIGLREIRALLAGEIDCATCEDLINAATRQYAKRQESWFRRETWLSVYQPSAPDPTCRTGFSHAESAV